MVFNFVTGYLKKFEEIGRRAKIQDCVTVNKPFSNMLRERSFYRQFCNKKVRLKVLSVLIWKMVHNW